MKIKIKRLLVGVLFSFCHIASAGSDRESIETFVYPIVADVFLSELEKLKLASDSSIDPALELPLALYPSKILPIEIFFASIYDDIETNISEDQLAIIKALNSSDFWRVFVEQMSLDYLGKQSDQETVRNIRSVFDTENAREELESRGLSIERVELFFEELSLLGVIGEIELMTEMVEFAHASILSYYSSKEFKTSDRELCLKVYERKMYIYSFGVCGVGFKALDYPSSLRFARHYLSGIPFIQARDLKKTKEIYQDILSFDKTGEAHYLLAMLSKNTNDVRYDSSDLYCMMKISIGFGFEEAVGAIKEFEKQDNVVCE